ncbi:MAG: DUF305 domain-containing protein [Gemmatimonadales bacterium]
MSKFLPQRGFYMVLALAATVGSGWPAQAQAQAGRPDSIQRGYTGADVRFMTGMIAHHAQAIVMSRWAPTHGASPQVLTLTQRIINSQQDEIRTMQTWLKDHGQPVPEGSPEAMSAMHGDHGLMPGMLTAEQMRELDAARGPEFDRTFLRLMIQHHTGALTMVDDLFGSYGAAQEDLVFKIASEIQSDQTTEIERMRGMLTAMLVDAWKSQ